MLQQMLGIASVVAFVPNPAPVHRAAHRVAFVTVAPDVRIETLDWGGRGPTLVFLAGFGNTGHVFDGFAPPFTNHYRVLAITRRGFGASSHPDTGYTSRTLTHDIVATLDSLGIRQATFVGHSFADHEIRNLASSGGPDSLSTMLQRGARANILHRVNVPVLAVWATPSNVDDQYPYARSLDSTARARLSASFADQETVRRAHLQEFREQVVGARVVTVVGARHFLFLTHARTVASEIRAFLASRHSRPAER